MAEENQTNPLAPTKIHSRSDEEYFAMVKPNTPPHRQKSSKCFVYILVGIVLQSIVTLVFALAVLRINSPQVELSSVAMKNLAYVTAPSLASLNVTIAAELGVKNNNFGGFKFEKSNFTVLYENVTVGGARIDRGRAGIWETKRLNVGVEVRSNGLLRENQNFNGDVNSGLVNARCYAKLMGRFRVMKIINKRKSTEMNCTMSLNLTTKAVQDLRCM